MWLPEFPKKTYFDGLTTICVGNILEILHKPDMNCCFVLEGIFQTYVLAQLTIATSDEIV